MAARKLLSVLLCACVSGAALANVTPSNQAVLNLLTKQTMVAADTNELNPYGLAAINFNMGRLQAGNFLATNWNSATAPGQGHSILQITPSGGVFTFATIDPTSPLIKKNCGTVGVGLTMALSILSRGFVIVGSTPVAVGSTTAGPGCLIVLDSNGNVLDARPANEQTSSNTMTGGGPWGMATQETPSGDVVSLFVSYVLGTNPASMATLSGANGGMVVRYTLRPPTAASSYQQGSFFGAPKPDVVASGFPTMPGGITGGTVGPAGLFVGTRGALANNLYIANNLNSSVDVVPNPTFCSLKQGAKFAPQQQCVQSAVAWGGLINGPIGIAASPFNTIVGANGGIGTLFEVAPAAQANTQLAVQLVDNANDAPAGIAGQGNLFNVLFLNNVLYFNNDNSNSFFKLTSS